MCSISITISGWGLGKVSRLRSTTNQCTLANSFELITACPKIAYVPSVIFKQLLTQTRDLDLIVMPSSFTSGFQRGCRVCLMSPAAQAHESSCLRVRNGGFCFFQPRPLTAMSKPQTRPYPGSACPKLHGMATYAAGKANGLWL